MTASAAGVATLAYQLVVVGKVTVDLDVGRRTRSLRCDPIDVAAPRELVFDVLMGPYAERPSRAMAEKVTVLERGGSMLLAAHRTPVRGGLVATTVETVRLTRPDRIDFRLVRGPVPHVVETFQLDDISDVDADTDASSHTRVTYTGELGTDLWALGAWWGDQVAAAWEQAVVVSLAAAKTEAERRARAGTRGA